MKTKYIALLITFAIFASCSDFLKEYSQDEAYVRSYVDLDELLLGDGYMTISSASDIGSAAVLSTRYFPYIHLMADEVKENLTSTASHYSANANQRFFGWYTWQKEPGIDYQGLTLRTEDADWNQLYKHISITNMVLAEIERFSGSNETERSAISRIKGEAHFLRAAYYFILVNLYGKPYVASTASNNHGVPIKLTEFIEDENFSRNSVQEVYDQILKDLKSAEDYLADTSTISIYRANLAAAQLLKARVYLYMQNWDDAASYADKVIASDYRISDLNDFTTPTDSENRVYFMERGNSEVIFNIISGHKKISATFQRSRIFP